MKSGYKILWTKNALNELSSTIEYLETNFTERELKKLFQKLDNLIALISQNPQLFQKTEFNGVHRVPLLRFNMIYYRVKGKSVEILSFFSNRQDSAKRKL